MTGAGWTGGCVSQNDIISVGVLIWPQLTHRSQQIRSENSGSVRLNLTLDWGEV